MEENNLEDFVKLEILYNDCSNAIITQQNIINQNRQHYENTIKSLNPESQYLGLATINFQNKIDNINVNNYITIFNLIANRIYGDYYKIYKSINKYILTIQTHIPKILTTPELNDAICNEFPIYKDLEQKDYNINLIKQIHDNIKETLIILEKDIIFKQLNLKNIITSTVKLCNFYINEEQSNIQILETKFSMYKTYISNSYIIHSLYINNLLSQITKNYTLDKNNLNIS